MRFSVWLESKGYDLSSASVIGFFSIPPASLAFHNPSAYQAAMSSLPLGSGTCSHCGTAIRHHVIIRLPDGTERFIGTDCAQRVGIDPEAVRLRLTSDQVREKNKHSTPSGTPEN